MTDCNEIDYRYENTEPAHTHAYLWNPVEALVQKSGASKVFDLGCGNGAFARYLADCGYDVSGVDPSVEGIEQSRRIDDSIVLEVGSAYDELEKRLGHFPVVVSLEVVEHVYYPRRYAACVANLLETGGTAIITTPYHGYFKNLALALTGKLDQHFTALWDHGHIKFWSIKTLTKLFEEQGMKRIEVIRVGRFPIMAKSMILVFVKQ